MDHDILHPTLQLLTIDDRRPNSKMLILNNSGLFGSVHGLLGFLLHIYFILYFTLLHYLLASIAILAVIMTRPQLYGSIQ